MIRAESADSGRSRTTVEKERRCRRYLVFRLLIILLGFGLVAVHGLVLQMTGLETAWGLVYGILSAYLAFGVASLLWFHASRRRTDLMRCQLVVDFVFQSSLVWATGGVLSIFTPLLFVTLFAATRLISARGSLVLATLATLALTTTVIAYACGLTPQPLGKVDGFLNNGRPTLVMAYLVASVLGLYVISALGSVLSNGLRRIEGIHGEILENMAEGLIAIDREGRIVNLNRESRELLGLLECPLTSKDTVHTLFAGDRFLSFRAAFERGERRRVETVIENLAGEERHVEVKVSTVRDAEGEARYKIGLISDLTLKREIEAAESRIQKLEELQVMAMGIAHEIRNPLASIRGCIQELGKIERSHTTAQKFMSIVCRESDRLDRIIEDFLLYARSAPADLVPMDLVDVIDEAVVLLRSRPESGNRKILWNLPDERPRVFGDRNRLIQLFLNLGINAIDATASEGEVEVVACPRERSSFDRRGGGGHPGVELAIRDNGTGMGEEEIKQLFTPFFTTKANGNGLGMCVVERIVREHLGEIEVKSDPDSGTTIRIWLPTLELGAGDEGGREREGSLTEEESMAMVL